MTKQLPEGYDVDKHFTPNYNPWDQRVCLVPNADLFAAIANGSASIVTDTIETFTETGLKLASGDELEADIVVTATGLNMLVFGGLDLTVDGEDDLAAPDDRLPGHDAQRRAELRVLDRLHERVVDAQVPT